MGLSSPTPGRVRQKPAAKLIIQENGAERVVELKGRATSVGRSQENDITIDDINSSRRHCAIERTKGGYEIVDLKSRNGTLVNGILILRKELRPGDCVEIGKTRIFFDHVSSEFSEETIDLSTDHFLEPLTGLEGGDQSAVLKKEREIFLKLLEINRNLNSKIILSDLLDVIIDTIVEVTGAERGFLVFPEKDEFSHGSTVTLTRAEIEGEGETQVAGRKKKSDSSSSHGKGESSGEGIHIKAARNMDREPVKTPEYKLCAAIARSVLDSGTPIRSDDAIQDRRFQSLTGEDQPNVKSVLCVPVKSNDRVLGAIYVDNRFKVNAFTENHLRWLGILSHQVAVAIRNAQMFDELRTRSKELEDARGLLERMNLDLENKVLSKNLQLEEVMKLIPRDRPNRFKFDYSNIITRSPRMYEIFSLLDKITDSVVPVLILGESGTGKELIARAIHVNGARRDQEFVSENCAAIPLNLLESEFFGHVRGAFTGASRDKRGLFEVAHQGTLFLDEIAEMSLAMQTKFLRVLQDGEIRRVGGKNIIKVNVRIVSATNRNIYELVRTNDFREDLLYRINVITVSLPALRDRREDILLLIDHFLEKIAARDGEKKKSIEGETFQLLYQYDWPGNIRELENEVERLTALGGDRIGAHLLSPNIQAKGKDRAVSHGGKALKDIVARTVEDVEKHVIRSTLVEAGWKKTRAAEILDISRPTLDTKIDKYGLTRDADPSASAESPPRGKSATNRN
jgi:transcriptional regulator with GAF, ATPase, and Fis domain